MTPRSLRRALAGLLTTSSLVIIGIVGAAPTGAAVTTTVANGSTITIPDQGNANPFPSTITASGLATSISGLTVELTSVDHTCAKDLDVLLVGPDGTKTTLLSDVGEVGVNFSDCNDLKKTVVVSDSGAPFGTSVPAGNPITVRPSDNDAFPHQADSWSGVGDEFAANNLASFNGKNPNGAWNLYVVDDAGTDSGSIAGWKLNITTPNGPPTATNQAIDAFKGEAKAVTLAGTDPDEDVLTCQPTTGATAKGTVTGAGCAVTYKADPGTSGTDTFGFNVADGFGGLASGTVTVTIGPASLAGCSDSDT
ncbi:MAG TPA: Ig-like domain-containing protein, partial [Iamia sp.]|nr:Ig-like domain-containing protein [Iamia sp.]